MSTDPLTPDSRPARDDERPADGEAGERARSRLSPERLREVLDRMGSGYHDRPDVREQIASRLKPDLPAE